MHRPKLATRLSKHSGWDHLVHFRSCSCKLLLDNFPKQTELRMLKRQEPCVKNGQKCTHKWHHCNLAANSLDFVAPCLVPSTSLVLLTKPKKGFRRTHQNHTKHEDPDPKPSHVVQSDPDLEPSPLKTRRRHLRLGISALADRSRAWALVGSCGVHQEFGLDG